MNYEIRIFANPAGFEEMSLNTVGKYSLFPQDVVSRRNFDGERGQLPNGTFSVYYTPDAYIIAYHFLLSSDAQFRDREAHIAVAIQRGFKMIEPTATFQELANEFVRIAIEFKSSAANKIYNNSEKFYSIVSARIVEDSMQFKFNTTYSVAKRAIIAVESPKERDIILGDPFRKELKDINILYIINFEDRLRVRHLTSIGYKPISNLKFPDSRSYTLVYPDGHRVEFTDLSQELPEYTVHRQYEKPLTFIGSVGSNMEKWKISFSEDKTEYIIGLQPEKDRKEYKVVAIDQNGCELSPSLISARFGQFHCGQWILEGDEITKLNEKEIFSIAGYKINYPIKWIDSSTLCIEANRVYTYDLSEIFKFLNDTFGSNVSVIIRRKNTVQRWQVTKKQFTSDIPYSELCVQVPETATTEESNLEFDNSGRVIMRSLRKKKTGEITISFGPNFPEEIKRKLNRYEKVGKIVYKYNLPGYKKSSEKDITISSYPIVISDLPLNQVFVEVEVNGYNTFQDEVNLKNTPNKEVLCDLIPTSTTRVKRYCRKHLPTFVVGVIFGILLGSWMANKWSRFLPSNQVMLKQIDALSSDTLKLHKVNMELEHKIEDLNERFREALKDKTSEATPPKDEAANAGLTQAQKSIIGKLHGEEFTLDDVDTAQKNLAGKGQDALIEDAEACLTILNLSKSEKGDLVNDKSLTYKITVNKLSVHRTIMTQIINDVRYKSSTRRNFKSIKEMKDYINNK